MKNMGLNICVSIFRENKCNFMFKLCTNCFFYLFNIIANLWENNKIGLISLLLIVGLLIVLFLIAERRTYFIQQIDKAKDSLTKKNLFKKKVTCFKTYRVKVDF